MEPGYRLRLYLLTALVLVGFGALLTRLHEFQIERRTEFLNQVPGNRTVTVREPGTRGEITDRNGITLARNLRKYEVSFNLEEIRNAYLVQHVNDPTIDRIARENGLPRKREEKDIVAIVTEGEESTIGRLKKLGLAKNFKAGAMRTHFLTHGGLIPYSYRTDLTYEEFSIIAEHNLDLPGVYLSTRPMRKYPFDALACHVIGYLKQWENGDVPESATRKFNHYVGDEKGIAGVEATMDEHLRGLEGRKTIVKDEKGRTIRMSDYTKPGTGATVQLAIDARIQYLLENTIRFAGRSAGVIMDVNTGEVLAMASVPDYNPNDFIPSISKKDFDEYNRNKQLAPFTNRAISAFTPGSTMKIPTAIAGAVHGMAGRSFSCDGYVSYGNAKIGCWLWNMRKGSHGTQDLPEAIQHSCNPYFNKLSNTIGWKAMVEGCQLVSIGKRTGIELPKEYPGSLPGSRAWRAAFPSAVMTPHETAQLSIGQGSSMATPLQMCAVAATVANGGKYFRPRVVRRVVASDGRVIVPNKPKLEVDLTKSGASEEDINLIREGMWLSVNKPGGTCGKVKLPDIEVAAKSGTAQTSDNGKPSHNSWVISFAPYENPKYAVCIMVQNGGSGGGVCGPLVNLVYRGLFARDLNHVKLPLNRLKKVRGNTDRIEKLIEITPEMIAAVEAGETAPPPDAVAALTPDDTTEAADEITGETGDEAGNVAARATIPPTDNTDSPTPTLTPEIDAEGTIIPKAVPVTEP